MVVVVSLFSVCTPICRGHIHSRTVDPSLRGRVHTPYVKQTLLRMIRNIETTTIVAIMKMDTANTRKTSIIIIIIIKSRDEHIKWCIYMEYENT